MTEHNHLGYTEDLSFDRTDPMAYSVFLPSLGPNYIAYTSRYEEKMKLFSKPGGAPRHPANLPADGKYMDFLSKNNGNFYWPNVLYSIGHADMNIDKPDLDDRESMIRKREPGTVLVGDSGGFQIGKGIIKFDWDNFESPENDKLRMKILRWLEKTADYSMTLDVPVWGIGKTPGIVTFKDCLEKSMHNNEFFIKNRKPGATRFLNVVHGRNIEESNIWWEAVKDLPFEGWAFASANTKDFELILKRLIVMRDGGYLDDARNWLHILGVSKVGTSIAYTVLQRAIRKYVNPSFTISYDASSPFLSAAKGKFYTRTNYNPKNISFAFDTAFDRKELVDSKLEFPIMSSLGRQLTVGDVCVRDENYVNKFGKSTKTSWDTYSYLYLMNHNLYMHIKGTIEAHRLYDLPRDVAATWIPTALLDFRDIVDEVFTSKEPFEVIDRNLKLLNKLSGMKMDERKVSSLHTSGFFALENVENDLTNGMEEEGFDDSVLDDIENGIDS